MIIDCSNEGYYCSKCHKKITDRGDDNADCD